MGSETIPPCKENIVHITLDKPLEIPNCQFKLMREGSLINSRAKEIHSRLEMPLNDRPIYTFNAQKVSYLPTIQGLVPESYLNYMIRKEPKSKKTTKGKKVVKKSKFAKWSKLAKKSTKSKNGFGPGYRKGKVSEKAKDTCFIPRT